MIAVTARDSRVREIKEAIYVVGHWSDQVEAVVCRALNSAYQSGLDSAASGRCRYRLIRWLVLHQGERGWTHEKIGQEIGSRRETVTRHIARLRKDGLARVEHVPMTRGDRIYHLTERGQAIAAKLDHYIDPLAVGLRE